MQMPNIYGYKITTQRYHDKSRNYIAGLQTSLDLIVNKTKSRNYRISMLADGLQSTLLNTPHFSLFKDHIHKSFPEKQISLLPNGNQIVRYTSSEILPPPGPGRVFWYAKTDSYMSFLYARELDHPLDLISLVINTFVREPFSPEGMSIVSQLYELTDTYGFDETPEDKEIRIHGVTYGRIYGISTP